MSLPHAAAPPPAKASVFGGTAAGVQRKAVPFSITHHRSPRASSDARTLEAWGEPRSRIRRGQQMAVIAGGWR